MTGMSSHDPDDVRWFPPEPVQPTPVQGPKADLVLGTIVIALLLSVIVVAGSFVLLWR